MDIFQALFGGLLWVPKSKKVSVFSLSQNCLAVLAWKSKASVKKLCKFKSKLNEKYYEHWDMLPTCVELWRRRVWSRKKWARAKSLTMTLTRCESEQKSGQHLTSQNPFNRAGCGNISAWLWAPTICLCCHSQIARCDILYHLYIKVLLCSAAIGELDGHCTVW